MFLQFLICLPCAISSHEVYKLCLRCVCVPAILTLIIIKLANLLTKSQMISIFIRKVFLLLQGTLLRGWKLARHLFQKLIFKNNILKRFLLGGRCLKICIIDLLLIKRRQNFFLRCLTFFLNIIMCCLGWCKRRVGMQMRGLYFK